MGDVLNDRNTDAQDDAAGVNPLAPYSPGVGDQHRHGRSDGTGYLHHSHAGGSIAHEHDKPVLGLEDMIRAFQVAMTDEEVPASVTRRVVNRVVYGDPCGPSCVRAADRDVVVHVHTQAVNAAELAREVHKLVLQRTRANGRVGLTFR